MSASGAPSPRPASTAIEEMAAELASTPHSSVFSESTRRAASCTLAPALCSAQKSTASAPALEPITCAPKPAATTRVQVQ